MGGKLLLYRTKNAVSLAEQSGGQLVPLAGLAWDSLFTGAIAVGELAGRRSSDANKSPASELPTNGLLPPIGMQEVWAAGVTYLRSRTARMEESAAAGGADFYDKVYHAHRPELFFKATPHRVVGHGQPMSLRADSRWNVPEPELTLAFTSRGELLGYTIGNDLSSRDIEGENPLYLPQAKVFDTCAALGPGLVLTSDYPPADTAIRMEIRRAGSMAFSGETKIANMKQPLENLREHLFRHNSFPHGCYLMTGTGIVPNEDFTLQPGDEISIKIEQVGTLVNVIR
jgi:2-dehydro-3-deoxy-D-arabinonate dehydratase